MDYVSEATRDERFRALKKRPENQKCFDCSAKQPQWATASFGIFLCMDCSAKHRSYGPHISFVRSITMDNWRESELFVMDQGGNRGLREFLKKHNVNKADYASELAENYKCQLEQKVAEAFKDSMEKKGEVRAEPKKEATETPKGREEPKVDESEKYNYAEKNFQNKTQGVKKQDEQTEAAKPRPKKKLGLGGKKIAQNIDFNTLVVDDLELQDRASVTVEENTKFSLKKLEVDKKEEPAEETVTDFKPQPSFEQKPELNKFRNYTGIGSDMLETEQNKKVNLQSYAIRNGFGSDQLDIEETTNDGQGESTETPFVHFAKRVGSKVTGTTSSLIGNLKSRMAK